MGWNKRVFGVVVLVLGIWVYAWPQVNRYIVHFSDKDNTPYSVYKPQEYLSERALDRRARQGILIAESDLPVDPRYIQGVRATGSNVYFRSKWLNAVLVETYESRISSIEALGYVDSVEYVAPGFKLGEPPGRTGSDRRVKSGRIKIEETILQNSMVEVDEMHTDGFHGEGILIGVFDAGFMNVDQIPIFSHLFNNEQILYTYDLVNNSPVVYKTHDHGTKVLSIIGGYSENEFVGTAWGADFMLFMTEDVDCPGICEYRVEEYNWLFAAELADSAGVDIINTSLGYYRFQDKTMDYEIEDLDGMTSVISRASALAASKGILLVTSAGNEGNRIWKKISMPADAEHVLTVGAVDEGGNKASFSSTGPTSDGRIKPDVVALGINTAAVSGSGSIINNNGTSLSTPIISGLAAGIWQAHPELTNGEFIDIIRNSGNNALTADNLIGYGVPGYTRALDIINIHKFVALFSVYPNPVIDSSYLKLKPRKKDIGNAVIKIFRGNDGKLISESDLFFDSSGNAQVISFEGMAPGSYIVNVTTSTQTQRFLVMNP